MRVARKLLILCLGLLPSMATAQELDDRWQSMGTVNAQIDGTDTELVVPLDTSKNQPYGFFINAGGPKTVSVTGMTIGEQGKPGLPMLDMSLIVAGPMVIVQSIGLQAIDQSTTGFWLATEGIGALAASDTALTSEGAFTSNFEATLHKVDRKTMAPIEGAPPIKISMTVATTVVEK